MAVRGISGDAHFFEESVNMEKIKRLLDNKTGSAGVSEKLQAMKTLLAMISKGEDVSLFFADVVKNVIVNSVEVKKMVYMYLVHYADANAQCRELALLSINSFQKDLADPNQLIRALALRVMTSIRVRDIIQIQIIAIRKCAGDSSPYVRKCAANALSKVHAMDSVDQKEVLAEIIALLLEDSSTMVLGSAVQALNEICPDRMDLLHRPFRKLCHLLADIDEWGQAVVMQVLTRYCREQFQSPKQDPPPQSQKDQFPKRKVKKAFYSDEDEDPKAKGSNNNKGYNASPFMLGGGGASSSQREYMPSVGSVFRSTDVASGIGGGEELDEDHRLLLRSSIPLLKSRNSAVVLSVSTLHYYCGTQSTATCTLLGKSLVRIMRNQREIQYVVLSVIASMATARPDMFLPFLQDFFVRATDPSYTRQLKLDILTALVTEDTVPTILREFQAYVRHVDKGFVTMTVRALGRVADAMPSVSEKCLKGLMRLVRSVHESVVAESVIVIRQLLQQVQAPNASQAVKVVRSLAAMMVSGRVTSPSARASIVWMLGEFAAEEPVAPETLRCMCATFTDEDSDVKLQLLSLAVKLALKTPNHSKVQLCLQYVVELCKFDLDYDIRDRARLVRSALLGDGLSPQTLFLSKKPAPLIGCYEQTKSKFTLGSLSELVHHNVPGYLPLPTWRLEKVDKKLRDGSVEAPAIVKDAQKKSSSSSKKPSAKSASRGFYSSEDDGSDASDDDDSDDDSEADSDDSDDDDDSEADSDEDASDNNESEEDEESSEEEEESSSEESEPVKPTKQRKPTKQAPAPAPTRNLLDPFDFLSTGASSSSSVNSMSMMADLSNLTMNAAAPTSRSVLLASAVGDGLQIEYSFLRTPSMYAPNMIVVQCYLLNQSSTPIARIRVELEAHAHGSLVPFPEVPVVYPGSSSMVQLHVDFAGKLKGVPVRILTGSAEDDDAYTGVLTPSIGELLHPFHVMPDQFTALWAKHKIASNELQQFSTPLTLAALTQHVGHALNLCHVNPHQMLLPGNVQAPVVMQLCGKLRSDKKEIWLLATIEMQYATGTLRLQVSSGDANLGDTLLDALVDAISSAH
ncbi:hypothetical protein SDRG_10954 [Saprolegnia diclina VS20]|uniref:AP-3 complex subunit beta n=1 Tax=Saprolegnia diclina (strain VS20) TaxID=1156394 RepID=T0RN13_SAPDV|nr:hypothetical protein SDRG_10954 [Saprolegnia diclina VS20]EQC31352.1 hypothetical protein SDRG_10954 [Saprolegnia diclina VS20]|eukprot:XP_008615193.1 hypothetical protein SDRG_10954 [Saprolegnia diclina VS20]